MLQFSECSFNRVLLYHNRNKRKQLKSHTMRSSRLYRRSHRRRRTLQIQGLFSRFGCAPLLEVLKPESTSGHARAMMAYTILCRTGRRPYLTYIESGEKREGVHTLRYVVQLPAGETISGRSKLGQKGGGY